jgi:NAD(P)-dependent dehydrogenase (short-subunit alcohol dehydrogenase family)
MLERKVILVTGAGNGIGAEIPRMAASRGAKVVVNDLGGLQRSSDLFTWDPF